MYSVSCIYENKLLNKLWFDKFFALFLPDDPNIVSFDIAPGGTVRRGRTVKFTCTVDANRPVHTYVLVSTDKSERWTKMMNSSGKFIFRCEARSSKGSGASKDTLLNVDGKIAGT